jgi:hypothetical protein
MELRHLRYNGYSRPGKREQCGEIARPHAERSAWGRAWRDQC